MDNIVTINNTKENTFELDVSVQGLSTPDIRVWFTISANGMSICFECEREGSGDKWICTVPPIPFIEQTAYPCSLQVVGDGYYFEPFNGTLNVVGNAEIYSTKPKNVTIKPANRQAEKPKDEDKKDDKKSNVIKLEPPSKNKTKSKEKSIEQIAEELMKKKAGGKTPAAKKVAEKKTVDTPKKITEDIDKKIASKIKKVASDKINVKKIVETLTPKKKVDRKEIVIPPAQLSNKLKGTSKKPVDTKKDSAVKGVLEGIEKDAVEAKGKSDIKIHTETRRSSPIEKVGEATVDIDQIAKELMERSGSDNNDKVTAPENQKDKAVMALLEDIGVKPEGAAKSVKISFIKKDIH